MRPGIEELDPLAARNITQVVGTAGIPPLYGYHLYTVGWEDSLSVLEEEYLASYIQQGGTAFKLVTGERASGKTHFLYHVRDLAWHYGYAVSFVRLTQENNPWYQLDTIYRQIAGHVRSPQVALEWSSAPEGLGPLLQGWYQEKRREFLRLGKSKRAVAEALQDWRTDLGEYDQVNFQRAVQAALLALEEERVEDFDLIGQWLSGAELDRESLGRFGITQKIDSASTWNLLRSLGCLIRQTGCRGLVILFDGTGESSEMSKREVLRLLGNLREWIDECGNAGFQHLLMMYAGFDRSLLEGGTGIYEALRQRLFVREEALNPSGLIIQVDRTRDSLRTHLHQIASSLARIHAVGFVSPLSSETVDQIIRDQVESACQKRYDDPLYRRRFVQSLIQRLNELAGVSGENGEEAEDA